MSFRDGLLKKIEDLYTIDELERLAARNVLKLLDETARATARAPGVSQPVDPEVFSQRYKQGFSEALGTIKRVCEQEIARLK